MKNLFFKKQNGITLVSVVITIIVITILAGVSVNMLGGNGLINKAAHAADEYTKAAEEEALNLAIVELQMDKYAGTLDTTDMESTIQSYIQDTGHKVGVLQDDSDENVFIITFDDTNNVYTIDLNDGAAKAIGYDGTYSSDDDAISISDSDITITVDEESFYTNDPAKVNISVTPSIDMTNFKLQYSLDGRRWNTVSGEIDVPNSGTVYARVRHIMTGVTKASKTATVSYVDSNAPRITWVRKRIFGSRL